MSITFNTAITPAITFENVSFSYTKKSSKNRFNTPVLRDINCTVDHGQLVCVVGANGAGKSTLAKLCAGILQPTSGRIISINETIGYISQNPSFLRHFHLSVKDIVSMGRFSQRKLFLSKIDKAHVSEALDFCRLSDNAQSNIADLSGGQVQRALIARMIASEASVCILDEPTASLDIVARDAFQKVLSKVKKRATVLLVTHDLLLVSELADKIFCLTDDSRDIDHALFLERLYKYCDQVPTEHLHYPCHR